MLRRIDKIHVSETRCQNTLTGSCYTNNSLALDMLNFLNLEIILSFYGLEVGHVTSFWQTPITFDSSMKRVNIYVFVKV